ncbi:hypothetical protein ACTVQD_24465 (plasmid) [Serratia marcescens]|uniref:hypothetical protein n=1 Tax=Serratia marcescens TaxID=615 RepID=UPI003FA70E6A
MTAREELQDLMEQHALKLSDVATIFCMSTGQPGSVRAVRCWLAPPEKAFARPCPDSVVEAVKTYLQQRGSLK